MSVGYPSRSRGTVGLLFNSPSGAQVDVTEYPHGKRPTYARPPTGEFIVRANRGTSTERFSLPHASKWGRCPDTHRVGAQ